MRKLIAGNWKMHPASASAAGALAHDILAGGPDAGADWLVCPPFPFLGAVAAALAGGGVALGAQDCAAHESGAHTGQVSAQMLADMGCTHVIVGHSERRAIGEDDAAVRAKAAQALAAGLTPIICVGEDAGARAAGRAQDVVGAQIAGSLPPGGEVVVAYEPVWAIGTGAAATPQDIADMHGFIRARTGLAALYGGSVKPDNAAGILALDDVGGVLVGGAALDAGAFLAIGGAA